MNATDVASENAAMIQALHLGHFSFKESAVSNAPVPLNEPYNRLKM
jgi:hypothetical protein